MDSRESGDDDIRLPADIHGIAKLKWYKYSLETSGKSGVLCYDFLQKGTYVAVRRRI